MKKHFPNAITSLNLLSGCVSVSLAFAGYSYLPLAAAFIFIAAVFDFLDGFVARTLHAYSDIGKQLDSLADMVSFGIAPSVIAFQMLNISIGKVEGSNPVLGIFNELSGAGAANNFITYSALELITVFWAFVIAVFSALRLAKFNIDERQSTSFIGLPTPANAVLFASFPLILKSGGFLVPIVSNTFFLIIIIGFQSFLLVSNIPLFSLKTKTLAWKANKTRFLFIITAIALLAVLKFNAIPFVIYTYILFSIASNMACKNKDL